MGLGDINSRKSEKRSGERFNSSANKDIKVLLKRIFPRGTKHALLLLPAVFFVLLIFLWLLPTPDTNEKNISIRALEIPEFPITLVLEQEQGVINSAWLRTPAGARKLDQLDGLTYISSTSVISKVDQDAKNDLLWRLSFINIKGEGVHIWIGMTTWAPRVFIYSSPFRYTRWHALPAKIVVPHGTSLYISPTTPPYPMIDKQYEGRDSYTFIYSMMMTPEGPAFVPVPSVYKQLSVLLKAGMQGETSPQKRLAYVRMLTEFNRLADGKAPQADTLINLPLEKIDVLSWKK